MSVQSRACVLSLLCTLVCAKDLEVHVRFNGGSWKDQTTSYTVGSLDALRQKTERDSKNLELGERWWLADLDGFNVTSWEYLVAMPPIQRLLSIVPEGKLFQWSPRPIGERWPVTVDGYEGVEMESVAATPRLFLIHNLFTDEEANFMVESAKNQTGDDALTESGVGFDTAGPRQVDSVRTSSNAFDGDSEVAMTLMRRAFDVLRVPYDEDLADGLQVLRYEKGQAYIAHTDWFEDGDDPSKNFDTSTPEGSNRFATVFLYLQPAPSGGWTVFPEAVVEPSLEDSAYISTGRNASARADALLQASNFYKEEDAWEHDLTEQCYSELAIKPVRLAASLFYHQEPITGELLHSALHGACPSLTGTKWGANLWVWNRARHLSDEGDEEEEERLEVSFENMEREKTLELSYSLDEGQTWVLHAEVKPGRETGLQTGIGHQWRFKDKQGKELMRWTVPEGDDEEEEGGPSSFVVRSTGDVHERMEHDEM